MTRRLVSSPFVLRYVYAMLAIVAAATATVIFSLYVIQNDDSVTRERVQSFHLETYVELTQLVNDVDTLQAMAESTSAGDTGAAGVRSLPMSATGLLDSIQSRLLRISSLQQRYAGEMTAATLQRLFGRFERIETTLRDGGDPVTPALEAFRTTTDQLSRLHTISADMALQALAIRQDQRPRFLVILVLCLGTAGAAVGYLIVSLQRALARQKEAELALAETQERLQNVQKLDALAQLVGGVAHDFNNLLTTVLGHAELLSKNPKCDDNLRSGLNEISTAGTRAATLTRQLLAFSRRQHADRSVLDLNEVLGDMEPILQRTLGDRVHLVCDFADEAYPIEIDPGQLQQVIMNLASNAHDAMPDGGTLTIETANTAAGNGADGVPDGLYLRLTIADDGPGMDKETRRRAFEPFFTTKEAGRGTGLGLSTVYGIVQDSGGHIVMDSHEGRGTEFRIYFPRAKDQSMPAERQPSPAQPQGGTETVLVVDDDEQVLGFVQKGLESTGYRVLSAACGATGLQICRQEPGNIDVILTDVVMSGMNGPRFLAQARRLRPDAAGIYMSAYTRDIILWRAKEGDEIPLVTKPFELESLTRVIRQSLDRFDESEFHSGKP